MRTDLNTKERQSVHTAALVCLHISVCKWGLWLTVLAF